MSTPTKNPPSAPAPSEQPEQHEQHEHHEHHNEHLDYLRADAGIRSWLFTKDHKRISLMFMVATAASLALGGVFALLLRMELLTPDRTFIDATTYNRFFTLHGVIMVFMFM